MEQLSTKARLMPSARIPYPPVSTLRHSIHSTQLRAAISNPLNSASGTQPTVTFCGDSTWIDGLTYGSNDSFNPMETLQGLVRQRLRECNQGVNFRFVERAIVGATWNHFATVGQAVPSWYGSAGAQWINSYVSPHGGATAAPDLVIIGFGTNDNAGINFADIAAAVNKFADRTLFPVTPDIWLATSMGRTTSSTYSTPTQITGASLAAAAVRHVAMCGAAAIGSPYPKPFGLIDFSRYDHMVRLGFDPSAQSLANLDVSAYQDMTTIGTTQAAGALLPQCDGDFDFQLTFAGQGATLLATGAMRLGVGAALVRGESTALFLLQRSARTSSVSVQYMPGVGQVNGSSVTIADGADVTIRCIAKNHHVLLVINGTTVFDRPAVRGHGRFQPSFWFGTPGPSSISGRLDLFRAGVRRACATTLEDADAWGGGGRAGPVGGNFINHPASVGYRDVAQPVLEALDFHLTA